MADTSGLKPLKSVVKKARAKSGIKNIAGWEECYESAIDGLREIRGYHARGGKKISKLDVDSTLNTADFPSDMYDYIDLAVPKDGRLWSLTFKRDINPTTTTTGGTEGYDSDIGEGYDLTNAYWMGYSSRGGVNVEGLYYVDWENKRFVLRNFTGDTLWLLYKTSGVDLNAETYVPVRYETALIAYILYDVTRYKTDLPQSTVSKYEYLWDKEMRILRGREWGTLQELWDVLNERTPLATR